MSVPHRTSAVRAAAAAHNEKANGHLGASRDLLEQAAELIVSAETHQQIADAHQTAARRLLVAVETPVAA